MVAEQQAVVPQDRAAGYGEAGVDGSHCWSASTDQVCQEPYCLTRLHNYEELEEVL